MPKKYDYEVRLGLQHNESPAKVNEETGDVTIIHKKNKLPEGKSTFMPDNFTKLNLKILPYLLDVFNPIEIKIILKMIELSEFNTNSLEPLNQDTSLRKLSEIFDVSINRVKKYFEHLYKMGVYAQFKVHTTDRKEFWILNPYISFQGKLIEDSIYLNFRNTQIELYIRKLNAM